MAYLDDVIKWKHFPRYWPFVLGIHRPPVNSPHKSQWRGALMFSLICAWIYGWVNNRKAGDLRGHRAHDDVTVMFVLTMYRWLHWRLEGKKTKFQSNINQDVKKNYWNHLVWIHVNLGECTIYVLSDTHTQNSLVRSYLGGMYTHCLKQ